MKGKKIAALLLTLAVLLFTVPAVPAQAAASVRCNVSGTVMLTPETAYTYTFKITVQGSKSAPVVFAGNQKLFKTKLVSHKGSDYYYQILGYGKGGDATGIYASVAGRPAVRQCVFEMRRGHFSNAYFQVYGDHVYYNYDFALYRMNLDGSGKTKVTDENVGWHGDDFVIDDNKAYYIDEKTERLYRIGLDGKAKQQLTAQPVSYLSVCDHKIYYIACSNSVNNGGLLMRYNPATGASEQFAPITKNVMLYQIMGGSVYYSSTPFVSSEGQINGYCELESVRLDGSGYADYGSLARENYTRAAQGNDFYYMSDYSGKLFHTDTETGKSELFCNNIRMIRAITPKWLYADASDDSFVRVDLTNGTMTKLSSVNATPGLSDFQVSDSGIYATFGYASYATRSALESNGSTMKESWDEGANPDAVRGIARFDLDGNFVRVLLENKGN